MTILEESNPDFICIQEHWLHNFESGYIHDLFPNHSAHVKCYDDNNPINPLKKPRGTGGTATLWDSRLDYCVEPQPDGSSRVNATVIKTSPIPTLLINTYMPTEGMHTHDSSTDVMDEIYELLQKFKDHVPL